MPQNYLKTKRRLELQTAPSHTKGVCSTKSKRVKQSLPSSHNYRESIFCFLIIFYFTFLVHPLFEHAAFSVPFVCLFPTFFFPFFLVCRMSSPAGSAPFAPVWHKLGLTTRVWFCPILFLNLLYLPSNKRRETH